MRILSGGYSRTFLAALIVFFMSIATVMGPTPPGTGVMKLAFCLTAEYRQKKVCHYRYTRHQSRRMSTRQVDHVQIPASPSKSTSPTSLLFPVTGSCTLFIPTSITAAPSLIMSAVMRFGIPDGSVSTHSSVRQQQKRGESQ